MGVIVYVSPFVLVDPLPHTFVAPSVARSMATGGTALLPEDALYVGPPMTYISPANASQGQIGGDINISITHYGGSEEDFDDMVQTRLVSALE